jgi:hypothetical protein
MWFDMIPKSDIITTLDLETNFLGLRVKYPIGLDAGIDNLGLVREI